MMEAQLRNQPGRQDGITAEARIWRTLAVLYRRRFFIAGMTGIVAVASLVLTLLMPNVYRAETRLLLPNSTGGGLLSMLSDLPSAARGFLGGQIGDYTRFLALLSSRTINERVIERFDLERVYKTNDSKYPREKALKILRANTDFVVDDKFEFLSITVDDENPVLAASVANYFVEQLTELNATLSSKSAGNLRYYVDQRYGSSMAALDSVMNAARLFQERHGVFNLEVQAEGFFAQIAEMRGLLARAEIEYETLRDQFGSDNERVIATRNAVESAQRAYGRALSGQERVLPVASEAMPAVVREYLDLERERMIQIEILKTLAPMREQARFEEERTIEAVQVVDVATPPHTKHAPRRSIIVFMSVLTTLILSSMLVISLDWWRRRHSYFVGRLRHETHEPV